MTQNKHAVLIYDENRYTCTVGFMDCEGAIQCQAILLFKLLGNVLGKGYYARKYLRMTVEIIELAFTKRLRWWGILKHLEYR